MLSVLLQSMSIKGGSVYGIELNLSGTDNHYWTLVQLKLGKNKEVKIVRQEYLKKAFDAEQLAGLNLKKSIPVVLCITGTGVLMNELGEEDNLDKLFPGLDEREIYHKEYETFTIRYAGVIRKDVLARLVEQLTAQGFFVWDVDLGSLSVLSILPLLQVTKQEFWLGGYSIRLAPIALKREDTPKELSSFSERCFIGTEQTTIAMLPSLAAAIGFFVGKGAPKEDMLKNQQKEFRAFKKCKLVGYAFLGLLLVVLFINFMLYSSYTKQLEDLQLALSEKQWQDMQLNTLKKELTEKQGILVAMGIQREIPLSYVADRFAACVPKSIKLDINPLTDKVKDQKPISFAEGRLRAEGVCDNPDDLNLLLEQLKKEEWLVKVEKKEYRENDLKGRFILEVCYE